MKKVFLGGACNGSTWRDEIIPQLKLDYFNPVVEDWTEECQQREIEERQNCDYILYVITPRTKGVYSIAEVIDDSNKRPEKTIFCILDEVKDDFLCFTEEQMKSLNMVGQMVIANGGIWLGNLNEVVCFLNKRNVSKTKREIKFEGKLYNDNIWYQGNLYKYDNGDAYIQCYNVDPETIGEFSGFKDHHGRDLYENNIVRVTEDVNGKLKTFNEVICFKNGCFSLYNPNCCEICKNGFGITCELDYTFGCFEKIEFIGRYPYDEYLLKN